MYDSSKIFKVQANLVISTFAPSRCGVGAYATQQVLSMRSSGDIVYTIGLLPDSSASVAVNLASIRSLLAGMLVLLPKLFDQATLHFVEGFFATGPGSRFRRLTVLCLQILFVAAIRLRSRQLTIQVHELATNEGLGRVRTLARRLLFGLATRIDFHTAQELNAAARHFGWRQADARPRLVAHDRFFKAAFEGDQAAARILLGLPHDQFIFLCIGFVQVHKGFTAAVTAMRASGADAHLYIVGAPRVPAPEILAYRDQLRRLVEAGDKVTFVEQFVDDQRFDAWIKAADRLIIPYHQIWTTGVGARAGMLGTPVAFRALPTLVEQLQSQGALPFETDEELARLMNEDAKARPLSLPAASRPTPIRRRLRLLLVAPYFAGGVRGGAEDVIATFARLLAQDEDIELTIWSTDTTRFAPRNHDAASSRLSGDARLPNAALRIFPCNAGDELLFNLVHSQFARGRSIPLLDSVWRWTSLRGRGMRAALQASVDAFDVVYLPHYFYGPTHELAGLTPGKTILHPFVHNEPALSNRPIRDLFAKVSLINVNSLAEIDLAQSRGRSGPNRFRVIGNCVEPAPRAPDEGATQSLLHRLGLRKGGFVLFVGRLERSKNCHILANWHRVYNERADTPLPLVFVGSGSLDRCLQERDRTTHVMALGRTSRENLDALMASSLCLANLSELESFSLVMMESWLVGRPVIVHEECAATSEHVRRSGAGLTVGDAALYAQSLDRLRGDDREAARLGALGRAYVEANFNSAAVYGRLKSSIVEVAGGPA